MKRYDVVVLGAGVVGVTTAYWLTKAGLAVCVIDRQPQAGLETSFANGGQISVSHAEPWANPSAPFKIAKWLLDPKAPLLFRPKFDIHQWLWIASFMGQCLPRVSSRNTTDIVALATESRKLLQQIRADERIEYDSRSKGILHFYRDKKEYADAIKVAELMRKHGCARVPITTDEIVDIEPAFEGADKIVGATYTAEDESGDAKKFTQELARASQALGATFLYGSEIVKMHTSDGFSLVSHAEVRTPEGYINLKADDFVVSMGCHSATFLRGYGVRLNIYPAKGYSVTVPITGLAPTVSLTDDENKIVYSNLGDRLRIAGTAELSGYTTHLNHARCEAIVDHARDLFPDACDWGAAQYWTGLRPTTPSNLPYLGRTRRYANLWLNTGHGTLGWTMACGNGYRVSEMICGKRLAKLVA